MYNPRVFQAHLAIGFDPFISKGEIRRGFLTVSQEDQEDGKDCL